MSRIGKAPVSIPDGVDVGVEGRSLRVKGPLGELTQKLTGGITATVESGNVSFERRDESKRSKALHGLYRALTNSMVEGVSKGFEKRLEVVGVSYQATVEGGTKLRLQVGFSHPVFIEIPKGVKVECPSPTLIVISGCDKQQVGEFAARARRIRPPEPYKGKGVRHLGEKIIQKAGKSFVGGEK